MAEYDRFKTHNFRIIPKEFNLFLKSVCHLIKKCYNFDINVEVINHDIR